MKKNDREKIWKATSNIKNEMQNNNFDADIENLNIDDSFLPIEEEEKQPLTEEEKVSVRKKLFILLVIIVLVIFGLIIVLIFNPFENNENNENNKTEKNEEETIETEDVNEIASPIKNLKDGEISLENTELQAITNEIIFNHDDYFENDTIIFYKNQSTYINDLKDQSKLFLVTKTNEFRNLISNNVNVSNMCNEEITIKTENIDKILNSKFNTTLSSYEEFTYKIYGSYEENDTIVTNTQTIKFTKNNDTYIGKCHTPTTSVTNIAEQNIESATKDKDKLYIDMKVVFIKESGIYKDPEFNELITNETKTTKEEYMKKANVYRYTYIFDKENYYLSNISLIK